MVTDVLLAVAVIVLSVWAVRDHRRVVAAERLAATAATAADIAVALLRQCGLIGCADTTQRRTR